MTVRRKAPPRKENGDKIGSADSTSITFTCDAARLSERNDLQYFEIFCNRGVAKTNKFSGKINWVQIGTGKTDHGHSIAEDPLHVTASQ